MWYSGRRFLLSLTILAASVSLALGLSLPIIKLTKYAFWSTEHSLVSTVLVLLRDGQTFLGTVVLVFSILLPILKLLYLLLVSTMSPMEISRHNKRLRALEWLGKWSMHDVLVLALTIFFVKSSGIYDAASLYGVYFFTAAVGLMILSYAWIRNEGIVAQAEAKHPPAPAPMATLAQRSRGAGPLRNFVLSFLIICAAITFVLGIILPSIRFTTVYVWSNEHSIASIIYALWQNEETFLCAVVFAVSILFPFMKLFYLLTLVTSPDLSHEFRTRSISTMEWLGRYSMTDVMVLALMIFYVNSSGYTEASVQPGVYFFAASAIITMLAYGWANTLPSSARAANAKGDRRPVPEPLPVKRRAA